MYTQCPACEVAFRVTADVLQQARGRVRCGNCREAFNALDHLSESAPVRRATGPVAPLPGASDKDRDLMDTLSQLAGPKEVRIEDTGIEWRVVDEDDDAPDDASAEEDDGGDCGTDHDDVAGFADEPAGEESARAGDDEQRYDDNSPLPEDLFDDDVEAPAWETPRRRAEDVAPVIEVDESQAELELGDADDWADLLGEVDDEAAAGDSLASDGRDASPDGEESAEEYDPAAKEGEAIPQLGRKEEAPPADADSGFYSNRFTVVQNADGDLAITEDDDDEAEYAEGSAGAEVAAEAETEPAADQQDREDDDSDEYAPASTLRLIDKSASADDAAATGADGEADEPFFATSADADDEEASGEEPEIEIDDDPSGEYESALALAAIDDESDDADAEEDADDEDDAAAAAEDTGEEPLEAEEEIDDLAALSARLKIDPEVLKALGNEELAATMTRADGSPLIETIIMEGDAIRDALDDDSQSSRLAENGDPVSLFDTYVASRTMNEGSKAPRIVMGAGIVVLLLALGAQLVHNERERLATLPWFDRTVGAVYRALGVPVTPDWDVKGWQFEATSGSTGLNDELLTISSRLSNRSTRALPYPLVHVSLTDRYEEVIGSRILEPEEYLGEDARIDRPVPSGDKFTATITVATATEAATGFKLNVCYREIEDRVRCAIEDFKEP